MNNNTITAMMHRALDALIVHINASVDQVVALINDYEEIEDVIAYSLCDIIDSCAASIDIDDAALRAMVELTINSRP